MAEEKMFPLHPDSTRANPFLPKAVPWAMFHGHEDQAIANHGQTLDRLANRGGLDVLEVWLICTDQRWSHTYQTPEFRQRALHWPHQELQKYTTYSAKDELDQLEDSFKDLIDDYAAYNYFEGVKDD